MPDKTIYLGRAKYIGVTAMGGSILITVSVPDDTTQEAHVVSLALPAGAAADFDVLLRQAIDLAVDHRQWVLNAAWPSSGDLSTVRELNDADGIQADGSNDNE